MSHTRRREQVTQEIAARTGIDEAMVERLVHGFYAKVRQDPLIGPVFAARITDWEPHLARMRDFWSSVALMTGRYHGAPMPKHVALPIDACHFDRWLALFEETAAELCPPAAAEHFVVRARRIAQSLEIGAAAASGRILAPGERFHRPDAEIEGWPP